MYIIYMFQAGVNGHLGIALYLVDQAHKTKPEPVLITMVTKSSILNVQEGKVLQQQQVHVKRKTVQVGLKQKLL